MKAIEDYSGDYIPGLKLTDFSPHTLDKILALHGKVYLALDGFWYLAVKELFGNEKAFICDMWAWEKVCNHEMDLITSQLNIKGNGVTDLIKALQVTSWMQTMKYKPLTLPKLKKIHKAALILTNIPFAFLRGLRALCVPVF